MGRALPFIQPENFSEDSLRKSLSSLKISQLQLVETCLHAFELLGRLSGSGIPFLFKGGTSLLLHTGELRRISTDIDIVTPVNGVEHRFLLNVCELIHDSKLPEQQDGKTRFRDFIRDPKRMPYLFESFVKNFFAREQKEFKVGRVQFKWAATGTEESLAVLPVMKTDVSLWSPDRSILLDCKFYSEAMRGWLGGEKLHASNLYQLYSYLRNAEHHAKWKGSEGVLLYPAVSSDFDHQFEVDGHWIRVVSINLDHSWQEIHHGLLAILAPRFS